MDLETVADDLYAVPPEEFVAARRARQDEARENGDRRLAQEIGALPKPSTAAWVCNVLVRAHRAEIEGLVELGNLLREAQENLAGDQLRALNSQRSQLLSALTREASSLARQVGHPVSSPVATQVEETLRAAMADPAAGHALLSGRLTSPMNYSGLGTATGRPDLRVVRPSTPERSARAAGSGRGAGVDPRRRDREEATRRAAEEQRRRALAEARGAAEEATAAAREAGEVADAARSRAAELAARHQAVAGRVEELRTSLGAAEREAAEVAADLARAEHRRRTAEREAADAAAARDHAVARVGELTATGD